MDYGTKYNTMIQCLFPTNAPRSSYNKGCRCDRCRDAMCAHNKKLHAKRKATGTQKPQTKDQMKRYRQTKRAKLKAFLKTFKTRCADCGWCEIPSILQFHHVNGVEDRINFSRLLSYKAISKEISECVCLCPTCHIKRHYNPSTDTVEFNNKKLLS